MKYIYWWICGILTLSLLVAWYLIVPTEEARKSKSELDKQLTSLGKLAGLAKKGSPTGVFDAESPDETKRLSESYLVTESWKNVLDPLGNEYQKKLDDLKQQLVSRGKFLRAVVTTDQTKITWLKAYIAESEKLIKNLRDAGLLPPMDKSSERFGSDGITEDVAQRSNSTRSLLNLHSDPNNTDPSKYTAFTAKLRVLQLLTDRLMNQTGEIAVNQTGPTTPGRQQAGLTLMGISFADTSTGEQISKPVTSIISQQLTTLTIGVTLKLRGPVSHLYAAVNAIERNAEPDRPIVVVTQVKLERHEAEKANDYLDMNAELAEMTVSVDVVEFAMPTESVATGEKP